MQSQIATFQTKLQEIANGTISLEPVRGGKWIRIVSTRSSSRTVYGFIDLSNGDLLFPASWKTPSKAKSAVRGNILGTDMLRGCTPYGIVYVHNAR